MGALQSPQVGFYSGSCFFFVVAIIVDCQVSLAITIYIHYVLFFF